MMRNYEILAPQLREDPNRPPRKYLRAQVYRAVRHHHEDAFLSLFEESLEGLSGRRRQQDVLNAQDCVQAAYLGDSFYGGIPLQSQDTLRKLLLHTVQDFSDRFDPNYLARAVAQLIRLDTPELRKSPKDIYQHRTELDGKVVALDRDMLRANDLDALFAITRDRGVEIALVYYATLGKYIYFQGDIRTPYATQLQANFVSHIGFEYKNPRVIDLHSHPGDWDFAASPSPADVRHFGTNPKVRNFIYGNHVTWIWYGDGGGYPIPHGWHLQEFDSHGRTVGKWLDSSTAARSFNQTIQQTKNSGAIPVRV